MNKLFFVLSLLLALYSCKKESTNKNNVSNTSSNTTPDDGTISDFDCSNIQNYNILKIDQEIKEGQVRLPYFGGNGKSYASKSYASTGVLGLTATLDAGTLENGDGNLVIYISGIPTSGGKAFFDISLGSKSCRITLDVEGLPQPIAKPGPNITDIDGNSYKTVIIGTQTWMAENLNVSKYNDGTPIPNVIDESKWSNETLIDKGAWCISDCGDKLYSGYTIIQPNKNLCPSGWHIPKVEEWNILIDYLGGHSGDKMKLESYSWNNSLTNARATNESLFSGEPCGYRNGNGIYDRDLKQGDWKQGAWWSSSKDTSICPVSNCSEGLYHLNIKIILSDANSKNSRGLDEGLSVRCIKN